MSDLIDTVLECFLRRSAEERIGSAVVEILADTAVALASANVRLVARKIISKLCFVSSSNFVYTSFTQIESINLYLRVGVRTNMYFSNHKSRTTCSVERYNDPLQIFVNAVFQ